MPPVTKSQSGQVLNNGSLSVPQSSATAAAGGFESYRNRDMIECETSHDRWLGDGLFSSSAGRWWRISRRGFINWVRVVRAISQQGDNLAGRFADPILPAKRSVLPRAMSEERDIWLRLRSLNRYQTPHDFRSSSENIADLRCNYDRLWNRSAPKQSARSRSQS